MSDPTQKRGAGQPAATGGPRGCLRAQLVALVVLGVLVALVEGGLRLVPVPGFTRDELDPLAKGLRDMRIEPHPYLAYANKPGYVFEGKHHSIRHNALGFRGPETTWEKPEGVFRVVCLGGSSTYGHGPSSNETTYPARLQVHLNEALRGAPPVEVINGGCQDYSTFESLGNLAFRMVAFEPDLVVVYHTINDARCALYPGVKRDNTHLRAVWPVRRPWGIEELAERSYFFLIARRYLSNYAEEASNLAKYYKVDFGRYADFYAQPTDVDLGCANFQRNLVSIVQVARSHGAEAVLVTQGLNASDLDGASSKEAQVRTFDRLTEVLKVVAAERGVPLVDARPVLERAEAAGPPHAIFTHEVHLTDAGADLLARTVADALLAADLVR